MGKSYKWGYIDEKGDMAIEPRFDDAWNFHEGLAAVKAEWARGYIDREGNYVIEPKYQYAGPFRDGKARVMLDDVWEYIDKEGKTLEEATPVKMEDDSVETEDIQLIPSAKGKKFGYADKEGNWAIKPQYIQAGSFSDGLAAVLVEIKD